jgi:hypothetical protein
VFKRPGEEGDDDEEDVGPLPSSTHTDDGAVNDAHGAMPIVDAQRIVIHEED